MVPEQSVLVTGAAGFIGSHLCERLLAEGYPVCGLDNFDAFYSRDEKTRNLKTLQAHSAFHFVEGDIRNAATLDALPEGIGSVIHLAAKPGVLPSVKDPAAYIDTNIAGSNRLLEWMAKRQLKRLVFASSSSVYGNHPEVPFREDARLEKPVSPYAFTKLSGELLNRTWHHLEQISVINLRFFTVFGPRQRPDLAIRKFTEKILSGALIHKHGDGNSARDYTYVSDIVDGVLRAHRYLENKSGVFETVNLGNHHPVKLNEMIACIEDTFGRKANIETIPLQTGEVEVTFASIEKAEKMLGWKPHTSFREGLQLFRHWYLEHAR